MSTTGARNEITDIDYFESNSFDCVGRSSSTEPIKRTGHDYTTVGQCEAFVLHRTSCCRNMHTMNVSMLNHSPDDLNDRKENLRQLMTVRLEQKTETINILRFHFGFRVKSHMEMDEMIMCVRAGELIESFTLLFW